MNVVREITRINQTELDIAINNPSASWHQQYKDSAYIFIGGLPYDLTEGDVITIFSQYGEVVDVNLPRANPNGEKQDGSRTGGENGSSSSSQQQQQSAKPMGKGKHRGFGFLMYEDQRSTVLAVDNLNGAQVLGRTLRVDHVASYKQPKVTDQEGNRVEAEVKSLNAAPQLVDQDDAQDIEQEQDLEDPMASYFQRLKREERGKGRQNSDDDDHHEKEEKRRRKEERARIRAEREQRRSGSRRDGSPARHRSHRHRNGDDEREHKRHRSHRSHDEEDAEEAINRYEQMKKSRSILDTNTPNRTERDNRSSRRRSRTPPSRDQERHKYRDDQDGKHRSSGHSASNHHHSSSSSSSSSRRRSRSPR
ncbi:related to rna binding motif protein [Ustilago trichophora]|uniref:Related to rna binding motif protein n=1 Tax=Ustilago trichophora TaxID=86804 RepID=A0A5C3ESP3_9BASI|nr:related to rna binding motif protein [Ustilago trichophora]